MEKKPGLKIYKEMKIKLPVDKNGFIDFNFIESFVKEIEIDKIAVLNDYIDKLIKN